MINMQQLARACTIKTFKAGSVIIHENDAKYDDMFILLQGQAQAHKSFGKPEQIKLADYSTGASFGEMSLFSKQPRSATVIAVSECTLISVTAANFKNLATQSPEMIFSVCATLCDRISKLNAEISRKTKENNYLTSKSGIKLSEMYKSFLYPAMHGNYPQEQPAEYDSHVILGKFTCPVCGETFSLYKPLMSTVVTVKMTNDGRQLAKEFEPLWYDFTACPKCYYSCPTSFFENKTIVSKLVVDEKLAEIRANLQLDFTKRKTLDDVFATYYLAILCAEGLTNKRQVAAKAWIGLSWLYEDLKETEMYDYATTKAYEAYKAFYVDSTMDEENTIKVCLVLAALAVKTDKLDEAYNFLAKVVIKRDLKINYKRTAEELKEQIKIKRDGQ